jgi:hypothetical protein
MRERMGYTRLQESSNRNDLMSTALTLHRTSDFPA